MGLKLLAEIALDGSGFERGLSKMGREAAASVKNLAVQAFGIYGVEQAIAKTVETATELVNTSKRLDVTVEQLQLLRQAAKDGGSEMGTLASAFEKLDIARAKALNGDKAAIAAFAKLGVSQSALQTQTAATLFTGQISNAAKNGNVESLAPAFKEVLGKGFGELIPVLKTDFDELSDKMNRLGSIMDTETAVKLKALSDNFDLLKNIMAAQLGPVLLTLVEVIFSVIGKLKGAGAFLGTVAGNMETLTTQSAKPEVMAGNGSGKINFWKALWAEVFDGGAAKPDAGKTPASEAAKAVEDDWKKTIDEMRKKLSDEANALSHPKPIVPEVDSTKVKSSRLPNIPADALMRVGNFLGANGNVIEHVNQKKLQYLKRIADSNDKIVMQKSNTGTGSFGMGVPLH